MKLFDEKPFGSKHQLGATSIVKCTKCAGYMLTTKGQKTKVCPYCGARVSLMSAQKVASASSAFEASEMLRKLKSDKGFDKR